MRNEKFKNIEKLKSWIKKNKDENFIQLYDRIMNDYPGMIERYEIESKDYGRDLSLTHLFECRGLDWSAHVLYKYIVYKFDSIEDIINYLINKYNITFQDMDGNLPKGMISQIDAEPEDKIIFQKYWDKFVIDFKNDRFIDRSLELLEIDRIDL